MQAWELLSQFRKTADAVSVPVADSTTGAAASAPLPELAVGNKPAPGLTGPKGLAPRTNYSRVNSGSPPPADLGSTSQKGLPTDPQGLLPPKVAHYEVPMPAMTQRFTIQDMIKAAAAGASHQVSVTLEGTRQLANSGEKVAAAADASTPVADSISTAYVEKLAAAVDYIIEITKEAEEPGPGTGPNALQVLEAKASNNEIEAGRGGTATPAHVPPKTPGEHKPSETPHGPANALEDNASMMHKEQPVKLGSSDIANLRKAAFSVTEKGHEFDAALADMKARHAAEEGSLLNEFGALGGVGTKVTGGEVGGLKTMGNILRFSGVHEDPRATARHEEYVAGKHRSGSNAWNPLGGALTPSPHEEGGTPGFFGTYGKLNNPHAEVSKGPHGKKEASAVDARLVDYFLSMVKSAEDAINPAQISAGAAVPPETSMAGESGGAPAGGMPEGPRGLVASNEAAINYQKGTAKAPVRSQLASYLTEPALSSAHDHTLEQAFDNTSKAGVKIASSVRALAARAVLEKMAEESCATATPLKKKVSMGAGTFQAPPVGGVAGAAS